MGELNYSPMYCKSCGSLCTYTIDGYCNICYQKFFPNYNETFQNWYECPDCHGKFTSPICGYDLIWRCPFCGKEMKGYRL